MSIAETTRKLWEAVARRAIDIRALPRMVEIGPGVKDGWPGPAKPGLTEAQLARRPRPRTLPRYAGERMLHAKVGKSFLKAWGSTDKKKHARRRARLKTVTRPAREV
jgi:hypothetical protein